MNLIKITARKPKELITRIADHEKRGAKLKDFGKNPSPHEAEAPIYWATLYPKEIANEHTQKAVQ